jgi:FlgD Ig-like domain/WD40-like Beta Propeller Repeat
MKNIFTILILCCMFISLSGQDWLYLGQTPPGMIPERFPPEELQANADWWWHSSPIFSPNGDEMFFVKYYAAQYMELNYMKVENGEWTEPETPGFVTPDYVDNCPTFSVTGDTLYFLSTRPGGFIFMTTKENGMWTNPEPLQIPIPTGFELGWQFSINRNRDIYLESDSDLYCTRFIGGNYQTPEALPAVINTNNSEFCPYIDPEDNFILFSSNRPGSYGFHDIYISSKDNNGNWTEAVNLGSEINTDNDEAFSFITYDNLYFFFTSQQANDLGYNPYWVDAQVIFDMITDADQQEVIPTSEIRLNNYPNPFNPSTEIRFQISDFSEIGSAAIEIYNLKGQIVKTIPINSLTHQPINSVTWNGTDQSENSVSSGIYYYKFNTPNSPVMKMLLLK